MPEELVGPQSRGVVVDRGGDDELVGLGLGRESVEVRTTVSSVSRRTSGGASPRRAPSPAASSRSRCRRSGRQSSAAAAQDVRERLLRRGEQSARRLVVVGDDHVRADHRVGLLQLLGGLEVRAVELERRQQRVRREVRGERVGQAEHGGELCAEQARAEDPERHARAGAGYRLHRLARLRIGEEALQLQDVLREGVGARRVAAKRRGSSAGRCPARGRGRGRSGPDAAPRASRTARRSRAARGSAA